jgi:hypothetical protein
MGPIGCPETSARNYHFALRKVSKERRSHLHDRRSLNSRVVTYYFQLWWDRILVLWRKLLLSGPCGRMLLFSTFIPSVHINTELLFCFKAESFQLAAHLYCKEGIHYSWSECGTVFLTVVWMSMWILVSRLNPFQSSDAMWHHWTGNG